MALSHGLLMGNGHATIRTPWLLALSWRLWALIQPLTRWLLCQLALSQIKSRAFLPTAWSLWQHHSRNCVGLCRSPAYHLRISASSVRVAEDRGRSRKGPSARDRPSSALSGGGAQGRPPQPKSAQRASQSEKTKSRPRSPRPTRDRSRPAGSADLEPLFSSIRWIGGLTPNERTISAYATAVSSIVACSY